VQFYTAPASDLPHPTSALDKFDPSLPYGAVVVAGDSSKWHNKIMDIEGGDAAILSASARRNTAGHDAIEARYTDPVQVAVFDLSTNPSGFTMTIFVEGQDEAVETFDVPAGKLFIGVEVTDEAGEGISAVRIAPKRDSSSPNGTYWWSMWETRFAL
jgi:hypothetical protein